jgi:hypothetical protein
MYADRSLVMPRIYGLQACWWLESDVAVRYCSKKLTVLFRHRSLIAIVETKISV